MATTNTAQKLRREANSLLGLSVINLVSSAMVLAFGASTLIPGILQMVETQTVLLSQLVLAILGFFAFIVGVRWIAATAEVIEIHEQLKEGSEKAHDEESLTAVIVGAMASYREKRGTIKAMLLISRIAGVCFLIVAIYTLISAVVTGGVTLWMIAGAIPNFAIAAAAFVIPHFFSKYQRIWDVRLKQTEKAEALLEKQLEA
jgi:hypothetical protein